MRSQPWSIVLAAGSGRHTATGGLPEQSWRRATDLSLVNEALVRLAPICAAERTVIVLTEDQRSYVDHWPPAEHRGHVVFQPEDRGTAAGVLFGLVRILATEPQAIVVIVLSDHAVLDQDVFSRGILDAVASVKRRDEVVLFGIEPSGDNPGGTVSNAKAIVARAVTVFDLCREHLPELTACFTGALTMPTLTRDAFLALHYAQLTAADFTQGVLARSVNLRACMWPASIERPDFGTTEPLQHRHTTEAEEASAVP